MGLNFYGDMPPLEDPGEQVHHFDHDEQVLVRVRRSHVLLQALETTLHNNQVISTPATDPHLDIRPPLSSPPPSVCSATTARSATRPRHTNHRHVTSCAALRCACFSVSRVITKTT